MKHRAFALAMAACLTFPTFSNAQPETRETMRADGSAIHWYLDRRGRSETQGVLVLTQGSGCASVADNERIEAAKRMLPDFAVVTVEKYGVEPHDAPKDPFDGCSQTYWRRHTVTERVDDFVQVLGEVGKQPWWNHRLVLWGGSEGGAAIAELSARVDADAVVVFSTGTGWPLSRSMKQTVPPERASQTDAKFADIRAHPERDDKWSANSYRWWADIMDRRLADDLLKSKSHILLVHGELDRSTPIDADRAARDLFAAEHRCNLTYWEMPGYDHLMNDRTGVSHLDEAFAKISRWMRAQLAATPGPCNA